MRHHSLLLLALLTFALLGMVACSGGGKSPATPPDPGASAIPTSEIGPLDEDQTQGQALGVYTAYLDFAAGTVQLDPVLPDRSALGVISERYAPDVTPFLTGSPCTDCFKVLGLSKDPQGNLAVDFGLKHAFPTTDLRKDLSVFDTRAIVIVPGTTSFPASPKVHTDGDGTPDKAISGNFAMLLNADGFTGHFDGKPEDTRYFNPPLTIAGAVNPFIRFFTEDDPSPTRTGFPIANYRFQQSPTMDIKRFLFALPPDGTTQLRVIVVLEAQWGVSANKAIPSGEPGARDNPVYFLPAFNQPEAYRAEVEVTGHFNTDDPPDTALPIEIRVSDWQAGMVGDPSYGDLAQSSLIPDTSDVARVTLEIPALRTGVITRTAPVSGEGNFSDPYLFNFSLTNDLAAPAGFYPGMIAVVDDLDGNYVRPTAVPGDAMYSFISYQAFTVEVRQTGGTNNPPVAVGEALPNPTTSGASVLLQDNESFDPDAGDSIAEYAWDFDVADGRTYTDSISANPSQANTAYTNTGPQPITITASLRVRDTIGATDTEDVIITVNPSTGANNPPVAVADANPLTVTAGQRVDFIDIASFDPDAGDSIVQYAWDFDLANGATYDDSVSSLANQAFTTYGNSGPTPIIITASLRVRDEDGLTDTDDVEITVNPVGGTNNPPIAVADADPLTVDAGDPVDLLDILSHDDDPGDSIVEYAWDFNTGNGTSYTDSISALPNEASTTYANPGTTPLVITAALRVKDESGLTGTDTVDITVNPVSVTCNATPPVAPANFRVPTLPEPPYDVNFIEFAWDASTDPCVIGYAVYRSFRWGVDNTFFLLTDLDGDNQIDANEVINDTTWADDTLDDGTEPWVTDTHYWYVVRAVKDTGSTLVLSANSKTIFVYFNDFEEDEDFSFSTFYGAHDGEIFGRRNTASYPSSGPSGTGPYGWGIATNDKYTGTQCIDESASVWAAGGFGPANNNPYPAALEGPDWPASEGWENGFWNTLGPALFTGYEDQAIPNGATVMQMQLFHKYQIKTSAGSAEDLGYVCVFDESDWENGVYKNFQPLEILSGKGYDGVDPGIPLFLDQNGLTPPGRDPNEQIPAMPFLAGDFATPTVGAPAWIKSVFDLEPATSFDRPVLQFCFAGDQRDQGSASQHFGWKIDDVLMVAY